MKLTFLRTLSVVIIVSFACPSTCRSDVDPDLLKLSAKVFGAIKKLKGALSDIKKVEKVVKDIEEERTPSVTGNQWENLAKDYRDAAAELREAPLPTEFDRSKYAFSLDELTNCATREASLAKARGYLEELQAARQRGQQAIADLDQSISEADDARKALKYLIEVFDKLVNVPIYKSIFTWDWFELNTSVSSSLGELTSALNAQKKKINAELSKLSLYIPNLQSNLTSLESLPCTLEGTWVGSWTYTRPATGPFPASTSTSKIEIKIRRETGQLRGEFLRDDGMKLKLENFVVNGDNATFKGNEITPTPGFDFSVDFSMKITNSGKKMAGTLRYIGAVNSTASLTKK